MFKKIALIIFLLFGLAFIWMFRYDIVSPTPDHLYKLDRWTGKTEHFNLEGAFNINLGKVENTIFDFENDVDQETKQIIKGRHIRSIKEYFGK